MLTDEQINAIARESGGLEMRGALANTKINVFMPEELRKFAQAAYRLGMLKGFELGFGMSGEGYNAEYPYGDCGENFAEESDWIDARDETIRAAVTEGEPQRS